jgi:tRNA pseudouridine55 synthase
MANGILIVDKPAGWTSQDVAAKLRGFYHERRVGHGGTLDPMATGVLPVFVGRATRAAEFCESAEKEYLAALRLGLETDTQDVTGRTLSEGPVNVSQAEIEAVLPRFTGHISQVPPMYSAIKINGQKLYQLARKGREVERAPRPVTIFSLELLGREGNDCQLKIRCSKGTYIRTLCRDIGAALGCGGCMAALRRTAAGRFTLAEARPLAEILACPAPDSLLLPVDALFAEYPSAALTPEQTVRVKHGANVQDARFPNGTYRVYGPAGEFLMLGVSEGGVLSAIKGFYENEE